MIIIINITSWPRALSSTNLLRKGLQKRIKELVRCIFSLFWFLHPPPRPGVEWGVANVCIGSEIWKKMLKLSIQSTKFTSNKNSIFFFFYSTDRRNKLTIFNKNQYIYIYNTLSSLFKLSVWESWKSKRILSS